MDISNQSDRNSCVDYQEFEVMKIDAKFLCNHCDSTFGSEDLDDIGLRCPVCDGYRISLVIDLWEEPDPTDSIPAIFDKYGIPT